MQTLIRNAAGLVMVVTDDKGDFLYMGDLNTQVVGAFYYANAGSWYNLSLTYCSPKVVSTFGVQEGDRITVSAVAIPELYEQDGELTEEQVKELISEGKLGMVHTCLRASPWTTRRLWLRASAKRCSLAA